MPTLLRTNRLPNPSFETASGTVNVRTNLLLNPLGRITGNVDVGPNVTPSYQAGGAVITHNNLASAGNGYFAVHFSAVSGTVYYARAVIQDVTGTPVVHASIHGAVGAPMGSSAQMTRVSTTLTREWSITSTVTGTARLLLDFDGVGTGESYRLVELIVSTQPTAGIAYWDGSTTAAGDFTYAWAGTANASISHQQAPGLANWTVENGGILHRTGTAGMGSPFAARLLNGGDFYKVIAGAVPGETWTFSVDYKTEGTVTGNPRLYISDMVTNTIYSPTLPLTQNTRERFSVTLPATAAGTTQINCAVFGSTTGAILLDNALFDRVGTAGPYYDGNTPDTALKIYDWTGAANASTSTESSVLNRPAVEYSGAELEWEFYSRQSGLQAGTLADHKYYFYKNTLGTEGSRNDLEKAYWATKSGLGAGFSLDDHRQAAYETATAGAYNDNGKSYYAQFFS